MGGRSSLELLQRLLARFQRRQQLIGDRRRRRLAEFSDLGAQAAEIVFGGLRAPGCLLSGRLQGRDAIVAFRQRRFAFGQFGFAALEFLGHTGGGQRLAGPQPCGQTLGQNRHLVRGLAGQIDHRLVRFQQRPPQSLRLLVEIGARLCRTAHATAQLLDLLALRARHAQQALGLALRLGQPLSQLGQCRFRGLDFCRKLRPGGLGRRFLARACRDLNQGITQVQGLVVAAQREVVAWLLILGLGQLRLDLQLGRGLVELGDAPGGKSRLTEHAHLGKMRTQPVDDVEVGYARRGQVGSVAVGHHANQAPTGRHQLQHRRQGQGPTVLQDIRSLRDQDHIERTSLFQRSGRHGEETQGAGF